MSSLLFGRFISCLVMLCCLVSCNASRVFAANAAEEDVFVETMMLNVDSQSRRLLQNGRYRVPDPPIAAAAFGPLPPCDGFLTPLATCIPENTSRAELKEIMRDLLDDNDFVLFSFLLDLGLPFTIESGGVFFDLITPSTRCTIAQGPGNVQVSASATAGSSG